MHLIESPLYYNPSEHISDNEDVIAAFTLMDFCDEHQIQLTT